MTVSFQGDTRRRPGNYCSCERTVDDHGLRAVVRYCQNCIDVADNINFIESRQEQKILSIWRQPTAIPKFGFNSVWAVEGDTYHEQKPFGKNTNNYTDIHNTFCLIEHLFFIVVFH